MQLVYLGEDDLRKWIGKDVKVTGTFFGAHTAHHNTPILIESRKVEAAD